MTRRMRRPVLWARAAALPALLAGAWLYAPHAASGPVFCLWRRLPGIHCPSCGLTRALCLLARGDPAGALRSSPLVILAVAGMAWVSLPAWRELMRLRSARPGRGRIAGAGRGA